MMNSLEKMFLYFEDVDEYPVSSGDLMEAVKQRKQDKEYKERIRNALVNAVREKKTSIVRELIESLHGYYIKEEEVIAICRSLFLDKSISLEDKVDKVIYEWQNL